MMGQAVQQGSGELFTVEDLGPLGEVQVGGHDDGLPFIAFGNHLEE